MNKGTGLIYKFGNKTVQNEFVGNFTFPINFIEDSYHKASYVAGAFFDTIFSDANKYGKYDLKDPNKTILEGRSWVNSSDHFESFFNGYSFTGESLSKRMKIRFDNDEIDLEVKGYSKLVAKQALNIIDEKVFPKTYIINIEKSDLIQSSINANSISGFEEVVLGYKLKKIKSALSKGF
jgi:hypothetical protein